MLLKYASVVKFTLQYLIFHTIFHRCIPRFLISFFFFFFPQGEKINTIVSFLCLILNCKLRLKYTIHVSVQLLMHTSAHTDSCLNMFKSLHWSSSGHSNTIPALGLHGTEGFETFFSGVRLRRKQPQTRRASLLILEPTS